MARAFGVELLREWGERGAGRGWQNGGFLNSQVNQYFFCVLKCLKYLPERNEDVCTCKLRCTMFIVALFIIVKK
jgi:hypothetical protein